MSEKKRRDITLGEMQDECKKHKKCQGECPFESFCTEQRTLKDPSKWDLTDPPRFNEAQMALLKALLDNGIKKISRTDVITFDFTRNDIIESGFFMGAIKLEVGETLYLAELLGKERLLCQQYVN